MSLQGYAYVALSALTMAEHFQDAQGQEVLLFVDNIFRFVQAGSEVSTCWSNAFMVGYQPNLADEMGEPQERITSTSGHSFLRPRLCMCMLTITPTQPPTTFTHLDATTELSRQIAS